MNLWVEQAPGLMNQERKESFGDVRIPFSLYLLLLPSLFLFITSLSGSALGFHLLLLPESPCNGINMTITNLLYMLLHRAPSATKWHPFQYPPRWETVIDPTWLALCHWTVKLYRGVSSTDQPYEKWNHLLETVLHLGTSSVFPKSLHAGKNYLEHLQSHRSQSRPAESW